MKKVSLLFGGHVFLMLAVRLTIAFVDDRLVKIMLQRWLTRVCEDPVLMHDEEVRSFVESDFGVCGFF